MNGHLASIHTKAENDFVISSVLPAVSAAYHWIGATRISTST
jgi:hypothetical protein